MSANLPSTPPAAAAIASVEANVHQRPWSVPEGQLAPLAPLEDLRLLTEGAPVRTYGKSDYVYRHGDPTDGFYVVLSGRVKISVPGVGEERLLDLAGKGDLFGVAAGGGRVTQPTEAVSLVAGTRVASVSCWRLREVARLAPNVVIAFSQVLSERVSILEAQLEQTRLPMQARLARTFISLSERFGRDVGRGRYDVDLELRHEELASLASTTRASVTQAISAWRGMGLVGGTRGHYEVDVAGLRSLVELLEYEHLEKC